MSAIVPNTFHTLTLGCAKNTVDTESMAQILARAGYRFEENIQHAEIIVVNTCGFIEAARQESLEVINDLRSNKHPGQLLVAAGCLTQRYGRNMFHDTTGVDAILGTRRWMDIALVVQKLRQSRPPKILYQLPQDYTVANDNETVMRAAIQGSSAYLKIADGCRRPCAFCAIPLIKGTTASRPIEAIVTDAQRLQELGMKEIILIAQDTTDYGHDLGLKDGLAKLLELLVEKVPIVNWLRIMYAYPGYVTDRIIEVMAKYPQVLPYLDIPLQHAHPDTLRRMRRPANLDWIHRTLEKMRKTLPGLALRTTFIVGYPGETEAEFQTLLDFINEIRFDRVGTFQYSFEQGTTSEKLGDPIPAQVKQERFDRLMEQQQKISLQVNQSFIGATLDVLVEGQGEIIDESDKNNYRGSISVGRSYRDAPEIDGLVFIEGDVAIGSIVPVKITGALPYDLSGVAVAVSLEGSTGAEISL